MARRNPGAIASLAAPWALGLLTACSGGTSPGPETGPLCPSCTAWVGGETGDFESDQDECAVWFIETTDVTDEQARELGVDPDELFARVEAGFAESFRWELGTEDAGPVPAGFTEQTTISGSARIVGTLSHRQLDPERCEQGICTDPDVRDAGFECPPARYNGLAFELDVDLTLADGALTVANGRASALARFSDWADAGPSAVAELRMDLSRVEGTLRLEPKQQGPAVGELRAHIEFYDASDVRGNIEPVIHGPTSSEDTFEPDYWEYCPLLGIWPDDGG
jgi:hypothetical protein